MRVPSNRGSNLSLFRVMQTKLVRRALCAVLCALALPRLSEAQQPPPARLAPDTVQLGDLGAFRPAAGWSVARSAVGDPERRHRFVAYPGSGVLVNTAAPGRGENLATTWEHGDLELEFDFMLPRDAESGVFLQGRYELQLADHRPSRATTAEDAGAIPPVGGAGTAPAGVASSHPPRIDAARAPGLWQSVRVVFRAPRFDAQGRKTANARFVQVVLNGVPIHENVDVLGPTVGAPMTGERASGPLVVEGVNGPIAIRKLRYRADRGERLQLSDLRYRVYDGEFTAIPELGGRAAAREGRVDGLTSAVLGTPDRFVAVYDGVVDVPRAGTYLFDLNLGWATPQSTAHGTTPASAYGGGRLAIGGRDVIIHQGPGSSVVGTVTLDSGRQPFSLAFYKNRSNRLPTFELHAEGPSIGRHALQRDPPAPTPALASAVYAEPQGQVLVLRSFARFGRANRTHVASVGDPVGVHYSFDLARGALLHAWRGPFVETTTMWSGRGNDQLAEPRGALLTLSGRPTVAVLPTSSTPWPDSAQVEAPYRFRGYSLGEDGRPTFRYELGAITVEERLEPATGGLRRAIHLSAPGGAEGVYLRLATGSVIERVRDRLYAVDGYRFYLALPRTAPTPLIREGGDGQELLVPVRFRDGQATVSAEIIW